MQERCKFEVDFLRDTEHENIVDFKESFESRHELIIVMEFCESKSNLLYFTLCKDQDLDYQINKKRLANERFSEAEILSWFS